MVIYKHYFAAFGGEAEGEARTPRAPAMGRGPLHSCFLSGCQA